MNDERRARYLDEVPITVLKDNRVLVRADFNVLDDKTGDIKSDMRLRRTLPTIEYLLERRAKIILLTHVGRPKGKVIKHLSTKPIAHRLRDLLGMPVRWCSACSGKTAAEAVLSLRARDVMLLENVRFMPARLSRSKQDANESLSEKYFFIIVYSK